jgi:tungstate transport system substrate-binding protein
MRRLACLLIALSLVLALVLALGAAAGAAERRLRLATTTSTENTGLLDVLLPPFERLHRVKVDVLSVGTGKALALGRRCDVDVVLVHAPDLEERFVAKGHGANRRRVMHNYFIIAGPPADPAAVAEAANAVEAMRRVAAAKAEFISRGDNSGTHVKERELWEAAGVIPDWPGYQEAGQGMGAVLTMASQKQAYTLSDVGTFRGYLAAGKLELAELFTGDELLKNPYSVIAVNPGKCPQAAGGLAKAFIDYLVSPRAQELIGAYRAGGKRLFWPDTRPQEPPKPVAE